MNVAGEALQRSRQTSPATGSYRVFSLTWPAFMQMFWNKRNHLHKKRVHLPQDWFGTPTWPPFHCFGTPIWPTWRHVKTLYIQPCICWITFPCCFSRSKSAKGWSTVCKIFLLFFFLWCWYCVNFPWVSEVEMEIAVTKTNCMYTASSHYVKPRVLTRLASPHPGRVLLNVTFFFFRMRSECGWRDKPTN